MKTKLACLFLAAVILPRFVSAEPLRALIVDGQNNHNVWPKSTIMMRQYLEETGLYKVDIERTKFLWRSETEAEYLPLANVAEGTELKQAKTDLDFKPDFSKYDVVISNFGYNAVDDDDIGSSLAPLAFSVNVDGLMLIGLEHDDQAEVFVKFWHGDGCVG